MKIEQYLLGVLNNMIYDLVSIQISSTCRITNRNINKKFF